MPLGCVRPQAAAKLAHDHRAVYTVTLDITDH